MGQAFAGAAVVQNQVLLFHRVGNEEVLESLDAKTGAPTWRYAYPTNYRDDFGFDEGPRAVPVVANGIVYTFGAQGQLHAVDLTKGTRVWSEDTMKRFNVAKGYFGAAGSPLRRGGASSPTSAATKPALWRSRRRRAKSCGPPLMTTRAIHPGWPRRSRPPLRHLPDAGQPDWSRSGNGAIQFQRRWRARIAAVNAATPLVVGDSIFVSAQYGPGAGVLRVEGLKLVDVWTSDEALSNHYATSVYHGGYLYGYHGRRNSAPVCAQSNSRPAREMEPGPVPCRASRWLATSCSSFAKAAR